MTLLYLTADEIGTPTGGGVVTHHESLALQSFAQERGEEFKRVSREELGKTDLSPGTYPRGEPWIWDSVAVHYFGSTVKLAHVYSGTFSESVQKLKASGAKVVYTVAAHSIEASRKAHLDLGLPYPYIHLTEPELWKRYSQGYWLADVIVCPSSYSLRVVQEQHQALFGKPHTDVRIISHGCTPPEKVAPLPSRFVCGYLGSFGADKGVRYLLEAWKRLNYPDATLLLAGRDSTSDWSRWLIDKFGGGSIQLLGWVKDVSEFYGQVSLYVQPSATEAFGIEVLEGLSSGRDVLCSSGAGASDVVPVGHVFPSEDPIALANAISGVRALIEQTPKDKQREAADRFREIASRYTWEKVRSSYQKIYQELLS